MGLLLQQLYNLADTSIAGHMLELIIKVIFSIWIVPKWGYIAVCICEPVTWVICAVLIVIAAWKLMRSYTVDVK